MNIPADERRAFTHWLRTGRYPPERASEGVELKHNPWHDPDDGRFAYKNSGRHDGSWGGGRFKGGGGGTFGGGGATARGVWYRRGEKPPTPVRPKATVAKPAARVAPKRSSDTPSTSEPKPFRSVIRNGYTYEVDELGRTRSASGKLKLADNAQRDRRVQLAAGRADRRPTDHGGHFIAARFDGPTAAFNHFAQDAKFNKKDYALLESGWAKAVKAGKEVRVTIKPAYPRGSLRPSHLDVVFWVSGKKNYGSFPKESRRSRNDK